MQGYYLYCYSDLSDPRNASTGVDKKILSQIEVLNNNDCNCEFVYCQAPQTFFKKSLSCVPWLSDGIAWPRVEDLRSADYLYIRRPAIVGRELLSFLSAFKQSNPSSLVLYEIPTYPYDKEMTGLLSFALYKDRLYRNQLKKYVDYIVDLSKTPCIFGIPTIQMFNGVVLNNYRIKNEVSNLESVNIIAVAFFEKWHGIDRLLKGMKSYYDSGQTREVRLHLVGGGTALDGLKKMASDFDLTDKVIFHGVLKGTELDSVYDQCTLGIECLGIHRKDSVQVSSSLKSREYLAKGIPFVGSSKIDVFCEHPADFFHMVPADESPIDIVDLLNFHDAIYKNYGQTNLIKAIRRYAENFVSMDSAMSHVIDAIRSI